jgi:hypothetical protein
MTTECASACTPGSMSSINNLKGGDRPAAAATRSAASRTGLTWTSRWHAPTVVQEQDQLVQLFRVVGERRLRFDRRRATDGRLRRCTPIDCQVDRLATAIAPSSHRGDRGLLPKRSDTRRFGVEHELENRLLPLSQRSRRRLPTCPHPASTPARLRVRGTWWKGVAARGWRQPRGCRHLQRPARYRPYFAPPPAARSTASLIALVTTLPMP